MLRDTAGEGGGQRRPVKHGEDPNGDLMRVGQAGDTGACHLTRCELVR
jgi:hypothetical protein